MKTRFISETVIGILIMLAVLIWGQPGTAAITLIVLFPFITRASKIKGDEREMLIHYKTGNIAFALAILFVIIIYYVENISLNGFKIIDVWMPLTIGSIIFAHGIAGLFVLSTE